LRNVQELCQFGWGQAARAKESFQAIPIPEIKRPESDAFCQRNFAARLNPMRVRRSNLYSKQADRILVCIPPQNLRLQGEMADSGVRKRGCQIPTPNMQPGRENCFPANPSRAAASDSQQRSCEHQQDRAVRVAAQSQTLLNQIKKEK